MLYYIIPPIIIVISTSALIYFLFKKAQQNPQQNFPDSEFQPDGESKFYRLKELISNGWLRILERFMHRAKLLSLKFHNVSNEKFHAIRKKRQEIIEEKQEKEDAEVLQQTGVYNEGETRDASMQMDSSTGIQERREQPLVKQNIVRPDIRPSRTVSKSQLEDALIKRIAVNPRDIEAYERLGDYYMESSNQRDALECFSQVLRLNPSHHKAKLRVRRIEMMLKEK